MIESLFRAMWSSDIVQPHMNDLLEGNDEYVPVKGNSSDPLIRCNRPQEIFNGAQMPFSDEFRAVSQAYGYNSFTNFLVPLNTSLSKFTSISNEGEITSIAIGYRKASYLASMTNRSSLFKYANQGLFNMLDFHVKEL